MATHAHAKPAGTPTWTELIAPDVEGARSFYRAVFGWEYDIGGPEFGGYTTARAGDRTAAGIAGPQPGAPPAPAAWNLYFASDDVEADVARAVELGAKVLVPAMSVGPFGSMAICQDPTGGAFGLWQAGEHVGWQVTDEPGSTAWHELYTSDARAALEFYTALLGATADPMPGGMEYYSLKHGDAFLAGIMQIDPSWGGLPTQWVSYFAVADADEAAALIPRHGGKMMSGIDDSPFGRLAAAIDPAGASFKIIEVPREGS